MSRLILETTEDNKGIVDHVRSLLRRRQGHKPECRTERAPDPAAGPPTRSLPVSFPNPNPNPRPFLSFFFSSLPPPPAYLFLSYFHFLSFSPSFLFHSVLLSLSPVSRFPSSLPSLSSTIAIESEAHRVSTGIDAISGVSIT